MDVQDGGVTRAGTAVPIGRKVDLLANQLQIRLGMLS